MSMKTEDRRQKTEDRSRKSERPLSHVPARSGDRRRAGFTAALHRSASTTAFTLIELMASMAILGLIMVMLFSVFDQVNKAWLNGENRVETFTQARAILDLMSRELSQAIATPQTVFHGETNKVYFVAPLNTNPANQADLCEVGYVCDYAPAAPYKFSVLSRRISDPASTNIHAGSIWTAGPGTWWNSFATSTPLAEDTILNLTFVYRDAAGTQIAAPFTHNNLPATIQIFMDVVDSRTVAKLKLVGGPATAAGRSITNSGLRSFSTIVYLPNK